ncbi:MAG: hypothetical protein V1896_01235 [Candidatus Zambryskibacteria bacterium]
MPINGSTGPSGEFLAKLSRVAEEEQGKAKEWLADVQQFFSHDTSPTRRELAEALRQRAELIEADVLSESLAFNSGTRRT